VLVLNGKTADGRLWADDSSEAGLAPKERGMKNLALSVFDD